MFGGRRSDLASQRSAARTLFTAEALGIASSTALADEGGVSFWLPGL